MLQKSQIFKTVSLKDAEMSIQPPKDASFDFAARIPVSLEIKHKAAYHLVQNVWLPLPQIILTDIIAIILVQRSVVGSQEDKIT